MEKKKWYIDKFRSADEYGESDLAYQITFGSVECPGESIDDLSIGELIRLEKFIHNYVQKEQGGKRR